VRFDSKVTPGLPLQICAILDTLNDRLSTLKCAFIGRFIPTRILEAFIDGLGASELQLYYRPKLEVEQYFQSKLDGAARPIISNWTR
jgi:hypothetical protein